MLICMSPTAVYQSAKNALNSKTARLASACMPGNGFWAGRWWNRLCDYQEWESRADAEAYERRPAQAARLRQGSSQRSDHVPTALPPNAWLDLPLTAARTQGALLLGQFGKPQTVVLNTCWTFCAADQPLSWSICPAAPYILAMCHIGSGTHPVLHPPCCYHGSTCHHHEACCQCLGPVFDLSKSPSQRDKSSM